MLLTRIASKTRSGRIEAQEPSGGLGAGRGPERVGRNRESSAQPVPASRIELTIPGNTACAHVAPGMSATEMATAKERGDHGNIEVKARWIASNIRLVRWRRISGSGSSLALAVARLPSRAMEP